MVTAESMYRAAVEHRSLGRRGGVAASNGRCVFELDDELGAEGRVPVGWEEARRERPDLVVLRAAGFDVVHSSRFPTAHGWSVEELIGFVYSTSFLPRVVLGDRAGLFERDLRRELGGFEARNELNETIDFNYELARRPP